ncbi:MAG: trehalose-phosphatase [Pseudonocardia sp.]|nr:trehalose-phosphatase [Pseudonocardia sp.]
MALDGPLADALAELAATPRLLVACDFDGTLAPIVEHPSQARGLPAAMQALSALTGLPDTTVAAISGRSLDDLVTVAAPPAGVRLVGSHGAESDGGTATMQPEQRELHARMSASLEDILADTPGAWLETKPTGVAVHVREAEPTAGERVLAVVRSGPASWVGGLVTEGKAVIDLAVVHADKGTALTTLREEAKATGVLFAGDDVTDEKAFAALGERDVGVKVGDGETLARYRVASPADVAELLTVLAAARRDRR